MINFARYFLPDHNIFLENVNFERISPHTGNIKMNCKDTIVAHLSEPVGIKVTFNRTVSFDPEGLFYLSVSFSAIMRFNEETKDEITWTGLDIASEFRQSGGAVLNNLSSRASLLIAQITSASGQPPLITPTGTAKKHASPEE